MTSLFPFQHILPTHQGRAAEKILFTMTGGAGRVIPNNTHFDTTRANIEFTGAQAIDLPIPEGRGRACATLQGQHGSGRLEQLLETRADAVPLVMGDRDEQLRRRPAGQPGEPPGDPRYLRPPGIPLFLDACRFAENAWFIKTREPGHADGPVTAIVQETAPSQTA